MLAKRLPTLAVVRYGVMALASLWLSLGLTGCSTVITTEYEATALVTYTWQVEYSINPDKPNQIRREKFASTSLLNQNGQQPDEAVTGPDDRGLWWPELPLRPTIDEMEARKRPQERIGTPQLLKDVEYSITYETGGDKTTLPTNYSVYRQVVKAYPDQQPLELTLATDEDSVVKAEPR